MSVCPPSIALSLIQDQSMAHGSDRSRFVDMDYGGKRYAYIHMHMYTGLHTEEGRGGGGRTGIPPP